MAHGVVDGLLVLGAEAEACRLAHQARSRHLSELDPAAQDGQANDLMNALDFDQQPNPPLVLSLRDCP